MFEALDEHVYVLRLLLTIVPYDHSQHKQHNYIRIV